MRGQNTGEDSFGCPVGWVVVGTDDPCTGCGHCCQQMPCELGSGRPCVELVYRDGRHWCGLVLRSQVARERLLIGCGCGATYMPEALRERTVDTRPRVPILRRCRFASTGSFIRLGSWSSPGSGPGNLGPG
jgi:hypothetical protein